MNPVISLKNGFSTLIIKKKKDAKYIDKDSLLLPINTDIITTLNLSECNLTELPDWFKFNNLINVDLSGNQLKSVPYLILALNKKIQTLNLSKNKLSEFDVTPKCCSSLIELNLSDNDLFYIPLWLYSVECGDLQTLKMNNNPCVHQVQVLARYQKQLKTLELNNANVNINNHHHNRYLMEIPKLEKLSLSNILDRNKNSIKELSFKNYSFTPFLKELHLVGLGISVIPDDFIILENLEVLDLRKNYLFCFPATFTQLKHMKVLIVSENELVSLPDDIDNFLYLNTLLMSDNCIGSLPESMKQLEHLKVLDCYNNDFMEDILDTIKCIPPLIAFDCEQNMFEMNDDDYLNKRNKLREQFGFTCRSNGQKLSDIYEDVYSISSDGSSSFYENEDVDDVYYVDEENWDLQSEHSITDDMNLELPKFRFEFKNTGSGRASSKISLDPIFFEDAE